MYGVLSTITMSASLVQMNGWQRSFQPYVDRVITSASHDSKLIDDDRSDLVNQDDHTIIATFEAKYRRLVQYYLLAGNVYWFNRLEWVMRTSMLRTLAAKHRSSVSKMTARHKAKIRTPNGLRTCFEATVQRQGRKPLVARFGGIDPPHAEHERGSLRSCSYSTSHTLTAKSFNAFCGACVRSVTEPMRFEFIRSGGLPTSPGWKRPRILHGCKCTPQPARPR